MRKIYHEPKGDESEKRFLSVANARTKRRPRCFVGAKRASRAADVRKIDTILSVKKPGYAKPMSVPAQIKSSEGAKERFYRENPMFRKMGVPVFVIDELKTDAQIQDEVYRECERALLLDRFHFQPLFKELMGSRLSPFGKRLKEYLKGKNSAPRREQKRPAKPPKANSPKPVSHNVKKKSKH